MKKKNQDSSFLCQNIASSKQQKFVSSPFKIKSGCYGFFRIKMFKRQL